jgi:hypothetical protein
MLKRIAASAMMLATGAALTGCVTTSGDLIGGNSRPRVEQVPTTLIAGPAEMAEARSRDIKSFRILDTAFVFGGPLGEYLNAVARRLVAVSPQPTLEVDVRLVGDRSMTASARGSGLVLVDLEFLRTFLSDETASEDALAFVLAHELAHVMLGHERFDWAVEMQSELAFATGALNSIDRSSQRKPTLTSADIMRGNLGRSDRLAILGAAVEVLASEVVKPGYTRPQEAQADELAIDLMVRAGYNLNAVAAAVNFLTEHERRETEERELARQTVRNAPLDIGAIFVTGLNDAISDTVRLVRASYYKADDRKAGVNSYMDRWHADAPSPDIRREPVRTLLANAQVRQIFDTYRLAYEAEQTIESGGGAVFQRFTRAAATSPVRNDPMINRVQARQAYRTERGRPSAIATAERAIATPHSTTGSFLLLARIFEAQGQRARADQVVQRMRDEFDNSPQLLPAIISHYVELGRREDEMRIRQECLLRLRRAARCQAQATR